MVKIRFGKKKNEDKEAEKACNAMCGQTDTPVQQSLRSKLVDRKFQLRNELAEIEQALQILELVPAAENLPRIARRGLL